MCQACKAKIAKLEHIAAERLAMIAGMGGDISRMQTTIGELQTENARLRRIEAAVQQLVTV